MYSNENIAVTRNYILQENEADVILIFIRNIRFLNVV